MFGNPYTNPKKWETGKLEDVMVGKASNGFFTKPANYSSDGNVGVICVGDVVNRKYSNVCDLRRATADEKQIQKFKVQYGDMLFCRSSLVKEGIAKASIVPKDSSENVLFECHVIRVKLDLDRVIPEFMQAFTITDYFRVQMMDKSKTATMTTISQKDVISGTIYIPDMDLQKQFVHFAAQSDKSKFYGKSQFIEMFGDPVYNTMDWPTKPIKDIAPESNACIPEENEYWWLNLDMIESYSGMLVDKVIEKADAIGNSTHAFDSSMVLYSKLRPYLNKAIVPDGYGYATTELVCLKPNPVELNKYFLFNLLRGDCFLNFATKCSSGAQMPRMPMRVLREFPCIFPPMELQNKFVEFAEQSDKSKLSSIGYMF